MITTRLHYVFMWLTMLFTCHLYVVPCAVPNVCDVQVSVCVTCSVRLAAQNHRASFCFNVTFAMYQRARVQIKKAETVDISARCVMCSSWFMFYAHVCLGYMLPSACGPAPPIGHCLIPLLIGPHLARAQLKHQTRVVHMCFNCCVSIEPILFWFLMERIRCRKSSKRIHMTTQCTRVR